MLFPKARMVGLCIHLRHLICSNNSDVHVPYAPIHDHGLHIVQLKLRVPFIHKMKKMQNATHLIPLVLQVCSCNRVPAKHHDD